MATEIKESDWRLFRRLHKMALERFCQRVLKDVRSAAEDHADGYHDCYLKVFALIRNRDETIGNAFNDPRRSNAFTLLAKIKHDGLLTAAELAQFSPEARQAIEAIENVWRA
jgi:DNA-directed RNA polymerase specialized sigma24 family protein